MRKRSFAIFATISIIEDRREGFLQSVLVAPIPRMAIVLGKALGGTILATAQGALFLLLAPTIGIRFTLASAVLAIVVMLIVSFALTALGICIAWRLWVIGRHGDYSPSAIIFCLR